MMPTSLSAAADHIWRELDLACRDRDHGWRLPVLATVDDDGFPQARTVVLRAADRQRQTLTIYTDGRSPKVRELLERPEASLVLWSRPLGWQLRVRATARIDSDSPRIDALWQSLQDSAAAGDYLTALAPGSPWSEQGVGRGQQHALCVVDFVIQELDWLALDPAGHRRARGKGERWQWLVP